ncbi:SLC13 family permease [Moritella sp. 28]|uniref:SLC13 family permease n=1 Tax=Moritella sp. 28 TaxID=2746232 RepID=UPI001BA6B5E8|nr:SLC13 family permease [Moritella sp. 28]QUM83602.1 anion permease [Moritella sp. 28]
MLFVFSIFVLTIVGLIRFQSRPAYVFGITLLLLYGGSFVTSAQLVASVANEGLLTLILLMLCSLALEKTRLLRIVATLIIKESYTATWLRLFGFTVLSSAFLNNTAVVSTMLAPIRNNPHHAASKLLLPLSYAAILGGTLTLVGTSTNLIVNSLAIEAGLPALAFFDFTLVGMCVVLACGFTLFLLCPWLPEHEVEVEDVKQYLIDTKVQQGSSLIGKSIDQNGLRHLESLFLVEILRDDQLLSPVVPTEVIRVHDRLIFSGDVAKVMQLNHFDGLSLFAHENGLPLDNLTEVIVRPESMLLNQTLRNSGFRALFDAAVVAIKRDGEPVSGKLGDANIQAGDNLVLAVGDDFKHRKNINKNFIILSGVEPDIMLSGHKEWLVVLGFFGTILLSAIGLVPLFKGLVLLFGVLLLTGCLNSSEVIRRLPANLWVIISSALLLSHALTNSGLMLYLGHINSFFEHGLSPLWALIVVYLLTWWLTELVTNNAAAALLFPIAFGLANSLDANPMAFVMAVAFGASASFISPYGYQTNLMVFNAGHYQLKDFIKIGLPISLVYGVVAISAIIAVFGL